VRFCLAGALVLSGAVSAHADILVSEGVVRLPSPGAMSAAGYLTLTNTGADDDRLLSVTTDGARRAELHLSHMVDGVMQMTRQDDGIALPAGESVALSQGGLHVMLMGVMGLAEAGNLTLTLTFEHWPAITLDLPVTLP